MSDRATSAIVAALWCALISVSVCLICQRKEVAPSKSNGTAVIEWEHGFKTKRVIATRYLNGVLGYNIGFQFPLDPNKCDRIELFSFIEDRGGYCYQAGGYKGAEMFVIFKAIRNRDDADKILPDLVSGLDRVISKLP